MDDGAIGPGTAESVELHVDGFHFLLGHLPSVLANGSYAKQHDARISQGIENLRIVNGDEGRIFTKDEIVYAALNEDDGVRACLDGSSGDLSGGLSSYTEIHETGVSEGLFDDAIAKHGNLWGASRGQKQQEQVTGHAKVLH